MPPDIQAGPLPGTPPSFAGLFGIGPPGPAAAFPASLFASLLAQSGPVPDPKTTQGPKLSQNLKTMDTLPTTAFLLSEKPTVQASELLPLSSAVGTQTESRADAQAPTDAKPPTDAKAAEDTPPPSALPAVPVPVLAVPLLPVPTPMQSVPTPVQSAPTLVQSAPTPVQSVPNLRVSAHQDSGTPAVQARPTAALPAAAPQTTREPLPLPRTFILTAPLAGAPALVLPLPKLTISAPPAVKPSADPAPLHAAPGLPAAPVAAPAVLRAQAAPQTSFLPPPPLSQAAGPVPITPAGPALTASPIITAVAASGLPAPTPGKPAGNTSEIALKQSTKNPDTSTSAGAGGTPGSAARIVQAAPPAAAPERPLPVPPDADTLRDSQSADTKRGTDKPAADTVPTAPVTEPAGLVTKTETKPLPAADRAEMVKQVADGVGALPLPARPGAAQQMSLQLHPKDWGRLEVSVTVVPSLDAGAAKTVTAHIVAETPQVKAALQSGTGALHQALKLSGLHLEHLTVSVKPMTDTVKPAAESASAGFSSNRQGQEAQDPRSRDTPPGASFGAGTSFGSGQSGRQGAPHPALAARYADGEPDDPAPLPLPGRKSAGRIDTHA